ncbi:hypothetical protein Tco_1420191 [Tanacetum coccineum]
MVVVVKIRRLICVYCNYTSDLENTLSSHSARRHVEAEAELVANHKKDLRLKVPRQTLLEEIIGRKQVGRMVGGCSSLATQHIREVDLLDKFAAENTRASYPFDYILNAKIPSKLSYHIDVSRTDLVAILLKQLQGKVTRTEVEQKNCSLDVDKVINKHAWITFEKQSSEYNHENTVNKKVMSMFENTEDEYTDLISKKNIIKVIEFKGQLMVLYVALQCFHSFIGLVADGAYGQVPMGSLEYSYAGLVLDLLDMCLLCGFGIQDMLRLQVLKYQKNAGFVYKVNGDPVTRYKFKDRGIYHVKKIDEERLNEDACITIGDHRLSGNVDKSIVGASN